MFYLIVMKWYFTKMSLFTCFAYNINSTLFVQTAYFSILYVYVRSILKVEFEKVKLGKVPPNIMYVHTYLRS